MIKQTRKPIQSTKSMLINILRDMEAKHLSQYCNAHWNGSPFAQ